MATKGLQRTIERLRKVLTPSDLGDEHLLRRFVAGRDETAFAVLVRRHGPMVLGVARRILGNVHDSEDAFQAAFFILARKAGSVTKRQSLAGWLYQVAYRVALKARARNIRRAGKERQ